MKYLTINTLIHLKNSSLRNKPKIKIPYNSKIMDLLKLLYEEGLVQSFKANLFLKTIEISFKVDQALKNIRIVSSPSRSVYLKSKEIALLNENSRVYIFSTTQGLCTSFICKKFFLGGKLLFVC